MLTRAKTDAQKCGDSGHVAGFQCPAKSSSVKHATSLDTLPAFVTRKNQVPFRPRKPKAHQLEPGTIYAKEGAICSQSEDDSSSKD